MFGKDAMRPMDPVMQTVSTGCSAGNNKECSGRPGMFRRRRKDVEADGFWFAINMLRTAGVVFRTHGMEQGEVMMHIYMPGEIFGKAFQVEAVGITEGI